MAGSRRGVFFDVDGTLIDNTYFHVVAWMRACKDHGVSATGAQLHKLIGMGGDQFVPALTGREMPELDDAHGRHMEPFEAEALPFDGAGDLIHELRRRGAHIGVSTSSGAESGKRALTRVIGDLSSIDTLVTSDDTASSKPAPDLIDVTLQASGLQPDDVLFIGDTRWDIEAAARCNVRTISVLTGGWTERELSDAGAVAVFASVGDLLLQLDASPIGSLLRE